MNNSAFTSLSLKLIGVIFILSSLIDYITLAVPLNWQNSQWQIGLVTSIVDRGIVPMVGIAFILVAYWIDSNNEAVPTKPSGFDLRLPTFALATILGLIFLLMVPLHLNNLRQAQATALEQIEQGADQGAEQIQAFLQQVDGLSRNPQLLSQQIQQRSAVIDNGQFQGQQLNAQQLESLRQQRDQLQGLQQLSRTPQEYKKRIDELKKQLETQLLDRRKQAEERAKLEAFKQGIRIGLSSLMLAIVYSAIGWIGFRNLGGARPSRPKAPKR